MGKFQFTLLMIAWVVSAQAAIPIQVERIDVEGKLRSTALKNNLFKEIREGKWNLYQIRYPIEIDESFSAEFQEAIHVENGKTFVEVNSKTFHKLPEPIKGKIVTNLSSYYGKYKKFPTYRTAVESSQIKLLKSQVFDWLAIGELDIVPIVPAHHLMSNFAKRWAYRSSVKAGANCWHSSIASIFRGWKKARYMSDKEFTCHVKNSFKEIDEPSEWGDLISITYKGEGEVHGFTYLGVDSNDPNKKIVFTKNGYPQSYYLFMNLKSVTKLYSVYGRAVGFYRAETPAIDPSEDESAPCFSEFEDNKKENANNAASRWRPDPIIEAGLKAKPPTEFDAIELHSFSGENNEDGAK